MDKNNLRMKCSALNVDFSSPKFRPPRFEEAGAGGYFSAIISCSMKTVTDRHRRAAYHNKQS